MSVSISEAMGGEARFLVHYAMFADSQVRSCKIQLSGLFTSNPPNGSMEVSIKVTRYALMLLDSLVVVRKISSLESA